MADDNQIQDDLESRYLHLEPMDFTEEELATSRCPGKGSSMKDTRFDLVIGHIEDIIMEDGFQELQSDFMDKYYHEFEDTDENKFVYTDIHREYCELIEKHIEAELEERIDNFEMSDFSVQLTERKDELDGEIFEMLMTFSDFVTFKEMFLDYRAMKEDRVVDLSSGLTITSLRVDQSATPETPVSQQLNGANRGARGDQ